MKKASRGMTALEITMIIVVVTIIFAVIWVKGSAVNLSSVRAKTVVTHMRLVADMVETQKRQLGGYPLNIDAMLERAAYLTFQGNHARAEREEQLRNAWNGPYLKGVLIDEEVIGSQRRKFIDLTELIAPGFRGYIEFSPTARGTEYHYSVYSIKQSGRELTDKLSHRILNLCNQEEPLVRIKTPFARDHFTSKSYKPCGYRSHNNKIVRIHYYLGALR